MNFQSLIENSNEIIYEITLRCDRLFLKITSLGHEAHEMIEKIFHYS
jgi:hypothetical protein